MAFKRDRDDYNGGLEGVRELYVENVFGQKKDAQGAMGMVGQVSGIVGVFFSFLFFSFSFSFFSFLFFSLFGKWGEKFELTFGSPTI